MQLVDRRAAVVRDEVIGALALDKKEPGFYDEERAQVLAFANQAAIAIENAQPLRPLAGAGHPAGAQPACQRTSRLACLRRSSAWCSTLRPPLCSSTPTASKARSQIIALRDGKLGPQGDAHADI